MPTPTRRAALRRSGDRMTECACGCGGAVTPPARRLPGHRDRKRGPKYEVNPATGCWEWLRATSPYGYGVLRHDGRTHQAHRFYYEQHVGPIPAGLVIDHLCRNRRCVNPAHMEPVTNKENILRGESPPAGNAGKPACANGHEFTPENTYVRPDTGARMCRTCKRAVDNRRYHARKS